VLFLSVLFPFPFAQIGVVVVTATSTPGNSSLYLPWRRSAIEEEMPVYAALEEDEV